MLKDRRHGKKMTQNGLNIQTISTKRIDLQTDYVLLLGQATEKQEKTNPSHFLNFLIASRINGTFGFARQTSRLFKNQKSRYIATTLIIKTMLIRMKHFFTAMKDLVKVN